MEDGFPRLRCVGDTGILVEFGDRIDPAFHDQVLNLDQALSSNPFPGLVSLTPAYASLLVGIDPCIITPDATIDLILRIGESSATRSDSPRVVEIPVCYDPPYAPDLAHVASVTGRTPHEVVAAHLSVSYRVYMYGFAPGYAYLGGVPPEIQLPRRAAPVRGVPAGSVIIAGPQCIVTTIEMPTGWWAIGRSPAPIFRPFDPEPFLFRISDRVRFVGISSEKFEAMAAHG
jgi:inhibitor of KinA